MFQNQPTVKGRHVYTQTEAGEAGDAVDAVDAVFKNQAPIFCLWLFVQREVCGPFESI